VANHLAEGEEEDDYKDDELLGSSPLAKSPPTSFSKDMDSKSRKKEVERKKKFERLLQKGGIGMILKFLTNDLQIIEKKIRAGITNEEVSWLIAWAVSPQKDALKRLSIFALAYASYPCTKEII
jgi:hypothetical protein